MSSCCLTSRDSILQSTPRFPNLPFGVTHPNILYFSHLFRVCYISRPCHMPCFGRHDDTWWRVQTNKPSRNFLRVPVTSSHVHTNMPLVTFLILLDSTDIPQATPDQPITLLTRIRKVLHYNLGPDIKHDWGLSWFSSFLRCKGWGNAWDCNVIASVHRLSCKLGYISVFRQ
jgi:hypothetical protein